MAKHIGNRIVRFSGFMDLDGTPLSDWHDEYLDLPGMLCIYESEHKAPGKRFVYFYPYEPDNDLQRYFHSTAGNYIESDNIITLVTNEIYEFEIGEYLSEDNKELLWLNVFMV